MVTRKISLDELGRKSIVEFKRTDKHPFILVVDNIRSAYNVGSLFRSADAFLLERIILSGYTPTPNHNNKIEKTALQSTNSVDWIYVEDIKPQLDFLKSGGYTIIALEQTSTSVNLSQLQPQDVGSKIVLICGNEIRGVSDYAIQVADICVEIPQEGTKHSFNVGVATGIVLWHLYNMCFINR